jgi:hypothetical protein
LLFFFYRAAAAAIFTGIAVLDSAVNDHSGTAKDHYA